VARVAAVLMGIALVVDLFLALLRATEPESYAEEKARTLQILLSAAAEALLVTVAIFLMLAAFTRVAKALGRPEAQKSAMGCAVLMATVTFLVAPLAYVSMSKGGGSAVMIFILGLVLGVVGMVMYMRTVRTLVEQLEERAAGTLISLRD